MPSRIRNEHNPDKKQEEFRQYNDSTPPGVREFYRLNHTHQTVDFVREKKQQYLAKQRGLMSIWEALDYLNTLVDESDPDTDLSQIEHNLQTAEAIRRDCHPRCFVLAGFIHRAVVLPPHCAQTYRRGRAGCWRKTPSAQSYRARRARCQPERGRIHPRFVQRASQLRP